MLIWQALANVRTKLTISCPFFHSQIQLEKSCGKLGLYYVIGQLSLCILTSVIQFSIQIIVENILIIQSLGIVFHKEIQCF